MNSASLRAALFVICFVVGGCESSPKDRSEYQSPPLVSQVGADSAQRKPVEVVTSDETEGNEHLSSSKPKGGYPVGLKTSKDGYVLSPYATEEDSVDIQGEKPGTQIQCPYTQKIFLVP